MTVTTQFYRLFCAFSARPLYSPYIINNTEGSLLLETIFILCGIRVGPVGYPWSVFAT